MNNFNAYDLLVRVCAVFCEFWHGLADEWEGLLFVDVPMEDVELVGAHPGDQSLHGVHAVVIAPRVEEEAAVRKGRGVTNRSTLHDLEQTREQQQQDHLSNDKDQGRSGGGGGISIRKYQFSYDH